MTRLLGISILQIGEHWLCEVTVETDEGIYDYKATGPTPGLAATYALRVAGIL